MSSVTFSDHAAIFRRRKKSKTPEHINLFPLQWNISRNIIKSYYYLKVNNIYNYNILLTVDHFCTGFSVKLVQTDKNFFSKIVKK